MTKTITLRVPDMSLKLAAFIFVAVMGLILAFIGFLYILNTQEGFELAVSLWGLFAATPAVGTILYCMYKL